MFIERSSAWHKDHSNNPAISVCIHRLIRHNFAQHGVCCCLFGARPEFATSGRTIYAVKAEGDLLLFLGEDGERIPIDNGNNSARVLGLGRVRRNGEQEAEEDGKGAA